MQKRDFIRWKKLSIGLGHSRAVGLDEHEIKLTAQLVQRYFFDIGDINPLLVKDWYSGPHRLSRRTELFMLDFKLACRGRRPDGTLDLTPIGQAGLNAITTGFAIAINPVDIQDMPSAPYQVADIQEIFGQNIPDYVRDFFRTVTFHIPGDRRSLPLQAANADRLADQVSPAETEPAFVPMAPIDRELEPELASEAAGQWDEDIFG